MRKYTLIANSDNQFGTAMRLVSGCGVFCYGVTFKDTKGKTRFKVKFKTTEEKYQMLKDQYESLKR